MRIEKIWMMRTGLVCDVFWILGNFFGGAGGEGRNGMRLASYRNEESSQA